MENTRSKSTEKTAEKISDAQQQEDAALKITMQFFAEELLPYLGIEGKVVRFAPTELVQLEIHKLFEDFNLVMEDESWKHFEFQSTNEGLEGLKRFRSYEALSSYQNHTAVTTYVLFSGNIRNPMVEFTEGVNTYRVVPIIMKHQDAEDVLAGLEEKVQSGEPLTKEDLVPLTLLPLMGGELEMKERIRQAYSFLHQATSVLNEEIRKMEAVIYAMADKFLEPVELEDLLEGISMTKLGQMLVDKGRKDGLEKGLEEGLKEGRRDGLETAKLENARNLIDILDEQLIADRIGLPLETIRQLKKEASED